MEDLSHGRYEDVAGLYCPPSGTGKRPSGAHPKGTGQFHHCKRACSPIAVGSRQDHYDEIKDDEEELVGEQASNDNSSGQINAGLMNLSASLQQLREQADAIVVEEKAAKRARTVSPDAVDQEMGEGRKDPAETGSKGSFA